MPPTRSNGDGDRIGDDNNRHVTAWIIGLGRNPQALNWAAAQSERITRIAVYRQTLAIADLSQAMRAQCGGREIDESSVRRNPTAWSSRLHFRSARSGST